MDSVSAAITSYLSETPLPFHCAWLFGSHARNQQRQDSDVDVAVLFPPDVPTGLTGPLTAMRGDLERLLRREVDLVDLRKAPVDLVHRVLKEGQLVAERDAAERVRFEVKARNEYFDLLPHLLRYRRQGRAA